MKRVSHGKIGNKQVPLAEVKKPALKPVGADQQRGLSFFTYLLEAQREVLEFQLGILEDVLRFIKSDAPSPRPPAGN